MSGYWSKFSWSKGGWVTLSASFWGKRGSSINDSWRQKTRVPGLSRGVVSVILRLAVLIQYQRVTHTDTQTQRQTHDDGYHPRIASAARVKIYIFTVQCYVGAVYAVILCLSVCLSVRPSQYQVEVLPVFRSWDVFNFGK